MLQRQMTAILIIAISYLEKKELNSKENALN